MYLLPPDNQLFFSNLPPPPPPYTWLRLPDNTKVGGPPKGGGKGKGVWKWDCSSFVTCIAFLCKLSDTCRRCHRWRTACSSQSLSRSRGRVGFGWCSQQSDETFVATTDQTGSLPEHCLKRVKQVLRQSCATSKLCFQWKSRCDCWRFSTVIHSYCFSYIRNNITNVPYFRVKITWNFCADDDRFIFMLISWFDFFDLNCWSLVKQPIGTDAAFELRLQLFAVGTQRAIRGTKNFTWLAGHQTLAVLHVCNIHFRPVTFWSRQNWAPWWQQSANFFFNGNSQNVSISEK